MLTERSKAILNLREGMYIWTNEGSDLKAWVSDKEGNELSEISIDLVDELFTNKVIVLVDGDYPDHLFKYSINNEVTI